MIAVGGKITVDVRIVAVTPAAVLATPLVAPGNVWFPRSQIEVPRGTNLDEQVGKTVRLRIPDWLAEKHGILGKLSERAGQARLL